MRLWQALGVLCAFVSGPQEVESALARVLALLPVNLAPSVKQYHEIVATALLLKQVGQGGREGH